MKVDQDFSAAIFNADFEKAARLIVSGKNMNGVSSKETALQLARQKRSDVVALLRCGRKRLLSLDAQIVR
jgi:translation initiation factor IF-3